MVVGGQLRVDVASNARTMFNHHGAGMAPWWRRSTAGAQAAFQLLHDATGGAVAGARSSGQPVRRAGRVE